MHRFNNSKITGAFETKMVHCLWSIATRFCAFR